MLASNEKALVLNEASTMNVYKDEVTTSQVNSDSVALPWVASLAKPTSIIKEQNIV